MKVSHLSMIALTSVVACAMPTSAENTGDSVEAVSSNGVSATIAVTVTGSSYNATLTVTNNSAEKLTNWQVVVNVGPPPGQNLQTIWGTGGWLSNNSAHYNDLGSNVLFYPVATNATISPGGAQKVTWSGNWNGTTPSIVSVDGVANGTALAGIAAAGVDPIAKVAATAGFSIAVDYENGKLPNTGDSLYYLYDETIWSAASFRVAAGNATIEYDPNAPGYAFIPNSVKADLAFAQLDPTVGSYLVAGLINCFASTDGSAEYGFKAQFLRGYKYPGPTSSSLTNSNGSIDYFSSKGASVGGTEQITISANSTTDSWFGILSWFSGLRFPSYWTSVYPKFSGNNKNTGANPATWHGVQANACTPFNGGGGSSNPYFVISQNGAQVPALFSAVTTQCQNGCTGTMVLDPVPYAEPGAYYNSSGTMVGTQSNPFSIVGSLYATVDHQGQWATRTVNGIQEWGTFTTPVAVLGVTEYKYLKMM
jgi:hypothetical protein